MTPPDLGPLFRPRSVAIVGASERSFIASGTYAGLRGFGFEGPVYPVNPSRDSVFGLRSYPSLSDIPEPVDLAIVLVNANLVPGVIDECAARGVPAAVIMSSGFAEAGAEGAAAAQRIAEVADAHRIRVCGPGTFGLISVHDRVSAFMAPMRAGSIRPGSIAVVTQSGSLVNVLTAVGQERQIGFSAFVSAGSEASLRTTDYFRYFLEDERTRVVAAIVEQFRDPDGLIRAAERAAELRKALVVLKLGRSERARRASVAHTGALAGSPEFHDAVFRRYGVTQVDTLDQLVETSALLASALEAGRLPGGRRLGIVSISGGDCVLAADAAARVGLEVAEFAPETQAAIRALVPEAGQYTNPVDTGMRPMGQPGLFAAVFQAAAGDPNVDTVVGRLPQGVALFRDFGPAAAAHPERPILAFTRATQGLEPDFYAASSEMGVPIVQEIEKGFRAIRHAADFAAFLRRYTPPGAAPPRRSPVPDERVRALMRGEGPLTEHGSKQVLSAYGLPVTREALARTPDEAVAAAGRLGYPVALKLMSPQIVHKSEAGALKLGLRSAVEVRTAYEDLQHGGRARPDARIDGVLVQEMAPPGGVEVLLGMARDAQLGPGVLFGLGGLLVEVLRETILRIPPLDPAEARAMVGETRAGQVLAGVRGRPAADLEALVEILVRFSELCVDFADRLEAIDVNPLVVYPAPARPVVLDASIVLR